MNNYGSNLKNHIIVFLMFSFLGTHLMKSQIVVGLNGGVPIGDAKDLSTLAWTIDLGYLLDINDNFKIGPSVGYLHSFGDELNTGFGIIEFDDTEFVPIYGTTRFKISDILSFGADMGYAIGLEKSAGGGFYYSPRASLSLNKKLYFNIAYRGISLETASWDIISIGLELRIK